MKIKNIVMILRFILMISCCNLVYADLSLPSSAILWNDHYYFQTSTPMSWTNAESKAEKYGGHLIKIDNAKENTFLSTTYRFVYWIGLSRNNEDVWIWSDGSQLQYSNWASGEPNNVAERYVEVWSGGRWNDVGNTGGSLGLHYGIIEVKNNISPTLSSFIAIPKAGNPPLTVNFVAKAKDPDGAISAYQWDFHGDGRIDDTTSTGETSHTYNDLGIFKASVTIVDNKGAAEKSSLIPITVQYGPDLVGEVKSYTFDNETNTISIKFKVTNVGIISTLQFPVTFNLSNNGTKVLSIFKTVTIDKLGVGETQTLNVDYTFNESIYGKYILILADPTKKVAEVDETNNGTRIVVQPMKTK